MADERNAASRMETARKKEGAHNAANFPPVPTAGESATYDPYSNAALYRTLRLLARAKGSLRPVIIPIQINARSGATTQIV
jgi:hypothetical protein